MHASSTSLSVQARFAWTGFDLVSLQIKLTLGATPSVFLPTRKSPLMSIDWKRDYANDPNGVSCAVRTGEGGSVHLITWLGFKP